MDISMKISLGTIACTGFGSHLGSKLAEEAHLALRDYAEKLQAGQEPIGIPSFRRDQQPSSSVLVDLDLMLDEQTRRVLEREARRQGTSVDRLAAHAVLVYLADLDSSLEAPRLEPGPARVRV